VVIVPWALQLVLERPASSEVSFPHLTEGLFDMGKIMQENFMYS
jgi:hypothetical protein